MPAADEFPFRVACGIAWLLNVAVRGHYRRNAARAGLASSRNDRREGFSVGLLLCAYLLIPVYVVSPWFDFAHVPLGDTVRWVAGGSTMVAYFGLFWWAHQALGRNWSEKLEIHQTHVLVTAGPYRRVRHPMYSAFFVAGAGFLFLSANWLLGAAYLGALTWLYVRRVSAEEQMMIDRFGDDYREYIKRTGRLLPRLRKPE